MQPRLHIIGVVQKRPRRRTTVSAVEKALWKTGGLQSEAARMLGIRDSTLSQKVKKNARLQHVIKMAIEHQVDIAESKLAELIEEKHFPAIQFYLKCKAKDRGYVERQEIDARGQGLVVHLVADDLRQAPRNVEPDHDVAQIEANAADE